MNRLLSCSVALSAVFRLITFGDSCALADDYLVRQVSDFKFARSSGGALDFKDPWQLGNQLFFRSASSNGSEFYRTDGSSVTEYDLNPGPGPSSVPTWFHLWRNTLYLDAFSNALGWELYSTSGGTPTLVADIVPGPGSSSAGGGGGYAELGDYLYFFAATPQGSFGLYRTSGTGVEYVAPTSNNAPHIFNTINGALIFVGNGVDGEEFYRTDGNTISQLADVNPGPAGSNPQSLFQYGNSLYFHATGAHGTELFKTDGNSVTELDINPGPASSDPNGAVIFKNELYFYATRGNGYELFKTDGTNVTEFDVNPGPANSGALVGYYAVLGDRLFFAATGTHGAEIFSTDGTSIREFDINPGSGSSNPLFFKVADNAVYFSALGPQGTELYRAQDDEITLIDLNPGPASSNPQTSSLIEFNGSIYLVANGTGGPELFRVDGTNVAAFDIFPGARGSYPQSFTVFDGELFFSAMSPNGRAVYRIDGTSIREVFNPDPRSPATIGVDARITSFIPFENSLLFIGESSQGAQLYQIAVVPEPRPLLLVSLALMGIPFRSKRKQSGARVGDR